MSDAVAAVFGGFIEIQSRNGWRGLLNVGDISQVVPRNEGGTSIRSNNFRTVLVDVPIEQVIAAIRKAGSQQLSGESNGQ